MASSRTGHERRKPRPCTTVVAGGSHSSAPASSRPAGSDCKHRAAFCSALSWGRALTGGWTQGPGCPRQALLPLFLCLARGLQATPCRAPVPLKQLSVQFIGVNGWRSRSSTETLLPTQAVALAGDVMAGQQCTRTWETEAGLASNP